MNVSVSFVCVCESGIEPTGYHVILPARATPRLGLPVLTFSRKDTRVSDNSPMRTAYWFSLLPRPTTESNYCAVSLTTLGGFIGLGNEMDWRCGGCVFFSVCVCWWVGGGFVFSFCLFVSVPTFSGHEVCLCFPKPRKNTKTDEWVKSEGKKRLYNRNLHTKLR